MSEFDSERAFPSPKLVMHRSFPFGRLLLLPIALVACTSEVGDGPLGDGDGDSGTGSSSALGETPSSGGTLGGNPLPGSGGGTFVPPDEVDPDTLDEVSIVIEENTASACVLDGVVEADHVGFLGEGYSNTDNAQGAGIEWGVSTPVSQTVTVTVRYAAETGARSGELLLDGAATGTTMALAATGAWTTWAEESAEVALVPGNHLIRLEATTAQGLPNIDHVSVTGLGLEEGGCTAIPSGGECSPGERTCLDASTPQLCDETGNFQAESECAEGCTGGVCNEDGPGVIRITDSVPGWASVPALGLTSGTTGGGQNLGSAVTVSSMSALKSAASGTNGAIIFVQPGTYSGTLQVGSNKTIIGTGPGVTIQGNVSISDSSNIIVRNLTIRGNSCSSYDECRDGSDAVAVQDSAHHVWLDHLDIADGQDGNLDITKQADYITVSFAKFHYTYNKEHRFSNLISSSDDSFDDRNKLQITYMNSWWGDRVNQRMPRGRFGKIHLLNDYFSSQDSGQIIHGPGVEASYIIEGCFYDVPSGTDSIKDNYGTVTSVVAKNNSGSASGMNRTIGGPAFSTPYNFTAIPSSNVKALVTAPVGGAGNTCTFTE